MGLISLIIPIFNAEKTLQRCLDSVRQQTYSNLEVILIDDGSTDGSRNICMSYTKRDSRLRYLYQPNAGVSAARNLGLDAATGTYVAFLDSDDWLSPDYLARLHTAMSDCDLVIGGLQLTDGTHTLQSVSPSEAVITTHELALRFWQLHDGIFFNSSVNKLFRRAQITERFSEEMVCGEDMQFSLAYLQRTKRIATCSADGYFYASRKQTAKPQSTSITMQRSA